MSKRILSLVLALVMVLGTFGTVFAAETGNEKIDWLVDQGIVKGDASGNLMLDKNIDRASVAKLVVEALGQTAAASGMQGIKSVFADVPANHWSNGNINVVHGLGLMIGNNGKFMPSATISYAEVVTILVRMSNGFTAEEEKTAVWPASYIAKANELGILDDVVVANFSAAAVRKDILEMFYNAMVNKEIGKYSIVKAIVLENNRVETLGKDEVVVEIIKEVQRSNYTETSRKEKGDQEKWTISAKIGDVENLLGKVADFTLNKNNEVVKVTIDESYKVVTGAIKAEKSKATIGGTTYTIELPERYKGSDERIFRTYHNNDAYAYEDFYQDPATIKAKERATSFTADFAKATVKNGKVLFIDAFSFDDIAPVKEVKKDGAEVYVFDDARDGGVKRMDISSTAEVLIVEGLKFSKASREDIAANDVIHAYKGGYVVRKDAKVEGEYKKVAVGATTKVYIDDESYVVGTAVSKKPVFSYDGEGFETLEVAGIERTLKEFKDKKVVVLLDINNKLQFFTSDIKKPEFVALVDNIVGKDVRVITTNNAKDVYTATLDTDFAEGFNSTKLNSLSSFRKADLVYLANDDTNIDTMIRLFASTDNGSSVDKYTPVTTEKYKVTSDMISIGGTNYKVLGRTNVFVRLYDSAKDVWTLKGITMADFLKQYKLDTATATLEAEVITDEQFANMLAGKTRGTAGVVAHTIIFTKANAVASTYDTEIVQLDRKVASGNTRVLEVTNSSNNSYDRTIKYPSTAWTNYSNLVNGAIYSLSVTKDDNKEVANFTELIAANAGAYKVDSVTSKLEYKLITLVDRAGVEREYWLANDADVFGSTVARGSIISFATPDANFPNLIEVVLERDSDTRLAYWGDSPVATDGVVQFVDTAAAKPYVIIGGKDIEVIGSALEFFSNNAIVVGDKISYELTTNGKMHKITVIDKNVTLTGSYSPFSDLTVSGNLVIDTNITATNVTVKKDLTVNASKTLTAKDFLIEGNTVINGTASFNTHFKGNVTVVGTATFKNVEMDKNLTVTGTATFEDKVVVTGKITGTNNITATNASAETKKLVEDNKAVEVVEGKVTVAKGALNTLTFDATNNETTTAPAINVPVDHANGAKYSFTGIRGGNGNVVVNNNKVVITRTSTNYTFEIEVTITVTENDITAKDTKVFVVTVPAGLSAVTMQVKAE